MPYIQSISYLSHCNFDFFFSDKKLCIYISLFLLVRSVYFHNGSSARKSAKFPSRRRFPFGDPRTECTKRDTLAAEGRPRFSGLRREGNKRGVIELSRLCVRACALRKRGGKDCNKCEERTNGLCCGREFLILACVVRSPL